MESVLGRHRNLIIFLGVLFLQALGLAVQVKRGGPDEQDTRLIRIWAVDAITPIEHLFVRAQDGANDLWRNYFFLRGVRAENRELKEEIEKMRLEQVRLSEDAAQAHRLQSLLNFKEQVIGKTVAAQVIGSSGSDLSKSIYIDKGSDEGIAPDMAVITANGIVGKVLRVYPSTSLVLLINDQSSGVGALLEKSRLQVVVHGSPTGELMLEHVMSDEQVAPGETVLSSGGDQIFPKGLPVGTVTQVNPGREMFLNIKVRPAADLNRLEEVLVVTEKHEQQPVAERATRVRAADILAQRLPSVPDKPPSPVAAKPGTNSAAIPGTVAATGVKPQANGGIKQSAGNSLVKPGTVSAPKPTSTGAGGNSNNPTGQGSVHATSGPAQPATNNPQKKVEQTTHLNPQGANPGKVSDRSAQNSAAPVASVQPSATKPQHKPAVAQATPQSSDSQDTPH
jgi:rod shape-determining protein MreC